jgi:hypothetical protein
MDKIRSLLTLSTPLSAGLSNACAEGPGHPCFPE